MRHNKTKRRTGAAQLLHRNLVPRSPVNGEVIRLKAMLDMIHDASDFMIVNRLLFTAAVKVLDQT